MPLCAMTEDHSFYTAPERSCFGIGDYVRQKSGGPTMQIFANRAYGEWRMEKVIFSCRWRDENGGEKEEEYPEYELELVSEK
jgi:uncharacterized protein YodC (DUF2158 family)